MKRKEYLAREASKKGHGFIPYRIGRQDTDDARKFYAWLDEEVDKEGNLIVVSPRLRISSDKEDNTNKIGE